MSSNLTAQEVTISLQTDRLRAARERKGLSQHELARICGLGANQISRYENGFTDPSATVLAKLAYELDVSLDYLMGLTDVLQTPTFKDLTREQRKLIEAYEMGDNLTLLEMVTARLKALAGKTSE